MNESAEVNFAPFRSFIDIAGHPHGLWPGSGVVAGRPVANSYCLQNRERAIIYFESPNGEAGHVYPAGSAVLKDLWLRDGRYSLRIYHPNNGERMTGMVGIRGGRGLISLLRFNDALALLIR